MKKKEILTIFGSQGFLRVFSLGEVYEGVVVLLPNALQGPELSEHPPERLFGSDVVEVADEQHFHLQHEKELKEKDSKLISPAASKVFKEKYSKMISPAASKRTQRKRF